MRLRQLMSLFWGFFRELSDEAAYSRHLQLTGRIASPAEWKAFTDRRYRRKYASAKCC